MATDTVLCINPKCPNIIVHPNDICSCGQYDCSVVVRFFVNDELMKAYKDNIVLLRQFPEYYQGHFILKRDIVRSAILANVVKMSSNVTIPPIFRESDPDSLTTSITRMQLESI